jgi:hypothetical protein
MNNRTEQEDERILEVYLAEYKHVSASILGSEDSRRHLVSAIIGVIAASVSAVTIFQSQPIFYLFGALLLSLLTWIMVEETARTGIHNRYLRLVLGPKVQKLLKSHQSHPFQYTEFAFDVNPSTTAATVLAPAKYIIGLGVSALLFVLFLVEKNTSKAPWSSLETILFYATIFSFAFPVVLGLINIIALSLREIFKSFRRNVIKADVQQQSQGLEKQAESRKSRRKTRL